jgi:hypothetical protein
MSSLVAAFIAFPVGALLLCLLMWLCSCKKREPESTDVKLTNVHVELNRDKPLEQPPDKLQEKLILQRHVSLLPETLPPTLPKSVSNLFDASSDPSADEHPAVFESMKSFYEEPQVAKASALILRYVEREQAIIVLQATCRFFLLKKQARRLRQESVDIQHEAEATAAELLDASVREEENGLAGGSVAEARTRAYSRMETFFKEAYKEAPELGVASYKGLPKPLPQPPQPSAAAAAGMPAPSAAPEEVRSVASKSMGPTGLDLPDLEARARRKAEAATRAKNIAEAARNAADSARKRAQERLAESRRRREAAAKADALIGTESAAALGTPWGSFTKGGGAA